MMELDQFSARENDVINLLLQGKSNQQIAWKLGVAIRTVEFHLSNIYRKLEVTSRTEALLALTGTGLRESTGTKGREHYRESAVETHRELVENEGQMILRRIPMRKLIYIIGGVLLVTVLLVGYFSTQTPDYHSDEEITRAAIASAWGHFEKIELEIYAADPVQIGSVVLNQFLKLFRQRETHYAIRLLAYEILELDFIEEAQGQLYYTARIKVQPQDKESFTGILDRVFPYEESDGEIYITLRFVVFQEGKTFKLVDVAADS